MKITFRIEYRTVWGEELILRAGGRSYPMSYSDGGMWSVAVDASGFPEEYHYELTRGGFTVRSEWGNHTLRRTGMPDGETVEDSWIDVPQNPYSGSAIFSGGRSRFAGTAIPVFSLRSRSGFGTGEFNDLKKLIEWAAATGQSVIQLLPVNDTAMTGTWEDSYPYNANSAFALNPQYIHLPSAGVEQDAEYRALQKELNALPHVDYERVFKEKMRLLKKAFADTGKQVSEKASYKKFIRENRSWLIPYAAFRTLTEKYGTPEYGKWGEYSVYDEAKVSAFCAEHPEEISFHFFVQYHLQVQLLSVSRCARRRGVILKGDLPIGISRTSVDAWLWPGLFHLDAAAGAPPDAFSEDGQNWGFPTYDWDEMEKDGYAWWKARLRKMSEYFDAFRIDHILGFFRIWEIPLRYESGLMGHFRPALPYPEAELSDMGFGSPGLCAGNDVTDVLFVEDSERKGYWHPRINAYKTASYAALSDNARQAYDRLYEDFFYHRHDAFWKESALRKLPGLLASCGMIACGEDLGMIPGCVPNVMDGLRILSLEIFRMPKAMYETFADPASYPVLSVCTTSTHDMSTLRGWWEEDRELASRFYGEFLGMEGEAPQVCEPEICRAIIERHLASPSMFAILPLQDWLSIDGALRYPDPAAERINVPARSRHYWKYRMHLAVEDLLKQDGFNREILAMNAASGRC